MPAKKTAARPADNLMKYEASPVDSLIPYARNARTHSPEQVAKVAASIKEFGFINPVIIDPDGGIIAGHCRVLAAQKLGMPTVPTLSADHLTEAQRRAYILADNRIALDSGWDEMMLSVEMEELEAAGFDLSMTGFSAEEIEGYLDGLDEGLPALPDEEKPEFQQMTFTLHDSQAEIVERALEKARAMGDFTGENKNSNGNALARACELFLNHGVE